MINENTMLVDQCQAIKANMAATWLPAMRDQAMAAINERGMPTRREEDWKYNNLNVLNKQPFSFPSFDSSFKDVTSLSRHRIVFVNGYFSEALSQLDGLDSNVILMPVSKAVGIFEPFLNDCLPEVIQHRYPLASLNRALFQDGYYLYIPQNAVIDEPIHIVNHFTESADQQMVHAGHLVWAGPNSEATIVEVFSGQGGLNWQNTVSQFYINPSARLRYYKLQNQAADHIHTHTGFVRQHRDSAFSSANYTFGGQLSRDDWKIELNDKGAHCDMTGLYLPKARQVMDHHLQIEHNASHTQSNLYYKGLASERGQAIYNGRVIVPQDCQKIEANQYNPNILLSNKAEIDTKPELMINADDVKCTHGSTVGFLDYEALNYLRCRGMDYDSAMGLLLYAFAKDPVDAIEYNPLTNYVHNAMVNSLPFTPPAG